jgi:3-oxoacyl-[acyl-carrier protein] reductase
VSLDLAGKRVVVTGGTRGTGRAVSLGFARAGAGVVACYQQDGEAADGLRKELAGIGGTSSVIKADVRHASDIATLARACVDVLGGVDTVVNNVGTYSMVSFGELSIAEWQRTLETNVSSFFFLVQAMLPHLGPGASIINVGSAAAERGLPLRAHYTAAKAAIAGMSRSLCKELGPRGIRVNTVAPGITESQPYAGMPPQLYEFFRNMTALRRIGTPEDMAGPVLFLASDLARHVTGAVLTVDGGI